MNYKMNILTIVFLLCFMIIAITGSYTYDTADIGQAVKLYQEKHVIRGDAFIGLVHVNIMRSSNEFDVDTLKSNAEVNCQGIYYVLLNTYYKYIKFYDDATVVTFTTNCKPQEVLQWKENQLEGAPKGTYHVDKEKIQFITIQDKPEGYSVRVKYEGTKSGNKLYLESFSEATKYHSDLAYNYIEK
ncbi:MAG: hypothetical protein ACOWWR_13155 [Eubacteriales bacterium]